MGKKKTSSQPAIGPLTPDRAARLYRLIQLLGQKPQTRDVLTQRLGIGIRDFYRDLETLRKSGITVLLEEGKYRLTTTTEEAARSLPFALTVTLGEAEQLAKGRTAAHARLREEIEQFKSSTTRRPSRRR